MANGTKKSVLNHLLLKLIDLCVLYQETGRKYKRNIS